MALVTLQQATALSKQLQPADTATCMLFHLLAHGLAVLDGDNQYLQGGSLVRYNQLCASTHALTSAARGMLLQVQKEDFSADNCRITAITAEAEGSADGCFNTVMGPVCILSPLTVPGILAAAAAQQHISAPQKALGACLEQQLKQDRPVYNFDLPFYFSVDGQEDYVITDAFFSHYTELHNRALCEVCCCSSSCFA